MVERRFHQAQAQGSAIICCATICCEIAASTARLGLEDLARRRRDGLGPEADQAALSRLLALEHKLAGGETLTAVEFIDYGRLAATIIKEVAGER